MSTLSPSGLETHDYGTDGWNSTYSSNFELINTKLGILMSSTDTPGSAAVTDESTIQSDPAATTAEALTDSTGGSASQTIGAVSGSGADTQINNNFASVADEINKLRADNIELRTILIGAIDYCDSLKAKVNELLGELRETGGCGVLSD